MSTRWLTNFSAITGSYGIALASILQHINQIIGILSGLVGIGLTGMLIFIRYAEFKMKAEQARRAHMDNDKAEWEFEKLKHDRQRRWRG